MGGGAVLDQTRPHLLNLHLVSRVTHMHSGINIHAMVAARTDSSSLRAGPDIPEGGCDRGRPRDLRELAQDHTATVGASKGPSAGHMAVERALNPGRLHVPG